MIDDDNKPMAIKGTKALGPVKEQVTPEIARRRRIRMSRLLASGLTDDEIYEVMERTEGMKPLGSRRLIQEIYARWAEEDKTSDKFKKHAAKRRLKVHIRKAIAVKQWSAVANLEKTLMAIEGTAEDTENYAPAAVRLTEAVLQVLGNLDAKRVREIIEQERKVQKLVEPLTIDIPSTD